MKYLPLLCIAACAGAQEVPERERMLLSRIESLERRLVSLERAVQPATEDITNQAHTQRNALRPYDVSGNSFSINQVGLLLERAPFFSTSNPGTLKRDHNTALLGLIWWFGEKRGPW